MKAILYRDKGTNNLASASLDVTWQIAIIGHNAKPDFIKSYIANLLKKQREIRFVDFDDQCDFCYTIDNVVDDAALSMVERLFMDHSIKESNNDEKCSDLDYYIDHDA